MPYITRPAIANERLTLNRAGQIVLTLDRTTHVVISPLEFMQRLAALVPRPRLRLIRFHGVLVPNAKRPSEIDPSGGPGTQPSCASREDLGDHRTVFDGGDDLQDAAAVGRSAKYPYRNPLSSNRA